MRAAAFVLVGMAACASWVPLDSRPLGVVTLTAQPLPNGSSLVPCETAPRLARIGDDVVVLESCAATVAVFRRSVLDDEAPLFLGLCDVPCADRAPLVGALYAYSASQTVDAADSSPIEGEALSPETYIEISPRIPPTSSR